MNKYMDTGHLTNKYMDRGQIFCNYYCKNKNKPNKYVILGE